MAIKSSAGTCLSISAALPATQTLTAFQALTFTQVGELESVGDIVVKHSSGTFTNLCTGKTATIKGAEEPITIQVVCALDRDDAGQVIMSASRKSMANYSFCVTEPGGDKQFFIGKVMSEGAQFGGATDAIKAPYEIAVSTPSTAGDTIVIFNAP